MVAALNLNSVRELPKMEQGVRGIRQAEEPTQTASTNKAENDCKVKDYALNIKNTKNASAANNDDESTLLAKLRKAEADLEKAQDKLDEKQKKVDELKEKMNNTKNIFKKAGYAIAYGAATAGLWIAKKAVQVAEGYVLLTKKALEAFRKKLGN